MDLLKSILDPIYLRTTCFLCFEHAGEVCSLNMKFTLIYDCETLELTLNNVLSYLFPCHDPIYHYACTDCANLLLTMYTKLKRNTTKRKNLKEIMDKINEKIWGGFSGSEIRINLNLSNDCIIRKDININKLNEEVCNVSETVSMHECKQCSMKFPSQEAVKKHKQITHKNSNASLVCEFCGKDCKKTSTLHAHLNTHNTKTCPYCFKTLKSHSYFRVHVKNHEVRTKRLRKTSYKYCNYCSYKSLNKMSLEAHINKVHLKIRPYICNICQKGFYKKSNLTEHELTHVSSKNEVCEICGVSFFSKKTLVEHLRLHSNVKPFECEICSARFVTSGRRSDHFKRKHMEKTVSCYLCDKKFSLQKELNTHLKKAHNNGKSDEKDGL